MHFIIDTNVICVANEVAAHISKNDVEECQDFLLSIYEKCIFYVDSSYLVFKEYFKKSNYSGMPGIGDAFVKWLFNNQGNNSICRKIDITAIDEDCQNFAEFPENGDLENFDMDDRKFVAVSIASHNVPDICNASDSDWYIFRDALIQAGIKIKFLCSDQLKRWESEIV